MGGGGGGGGGVWGRGITSGLVLQHEISRLITVSFCTRGRDYIATISFNTRNREFSQCHSARDVETN